MSTAARPVTARLTTSASTTRDWSLPWHLWAVAFASTSVIVGVIWDISWHRTIGRDTFWTPAHLAIYLGGMVAGFSCGWLVLKTTFAGTEAQRAAGVRFWGFRGPLGAWVCIWGSFAMITSGPFDDWWHNAYGLDVEILSPPHAVLAAGILAIQVGAMLMALAHQNNAPRDDRAVQLLFAYAGGILLLMMSGLATEYIRFPNDQHGPQFFLVSAGIVPVLLVGLGRSSRFRWGVTTAAGIYMGLTVTMIWLLQLFPAQPMLAPILRQVDRMVPPPFPLLLVVPALVTDFLRWPGSDGAGRVRQWLTAVGTAMLAMGAFFLAQWYFADFLLSEHARNFFFAADQWDYNLPPGSWQYEFWGNPMTPGLAGWTVALIALSSTVGVWWGNWMRRVRR